MVFLQAVVKDMRVKRWTFSDDGMLIFDINGFPTNFRQLRRPANSMVIPSSTFFTTQRYKYPDPWTVVESFGYRRTANPKNVFFFRFWASWLYWTRINTNIALVLATVVAMMDWEHGIIALSSKVEWMHGDINTDEILLLLLPRSRKTAVVSKLTLRPYAWVVCIPIYFTFLTILRTT